MITITLTMRVHDEEMLRSRTADIIDEVGDEESAPLAHRALEAIFNKAPEESFYDYGTELWAVALHDDNDDDKD